MAQAQTLLVLQRGVAVLAIPVMLAELLFPMVPGSTSAKLTLVLVVLTVMVNGRLDVGTRWAMHSAVFGMYIFGAIARANFEISSFFVADFQVGLQGLLLSAMLAPMLSERNGRQSFFHDVGVLLVAVGTFGAVVGLAKLYLQTQGVKIAAFEWQGMYPRGTSLRIDYNVYALGLVIALTAAISLRASTLASTWQRALASVAVPLLFFTVAFTSSRRGLLFLGLVIPLAALSVSDARARIRVLRVPMLSLFGAAALIGALLLNGNASVLQRVSEYLDLARAAERVLAVGDADDLFETRAPLVADAWHQVSVEAGPFEALLGRGDSYLREMGRVFNREVDYDYPHNLLLSALLHGGVVLGVAVLVGIGIAILMAWRHRLGDGWVLAALSCTAVFALSSASTVYSFDIFVTLVMLYGVTIGDSGSSFHPRSVVNNWAGVHS